MSGDEALARRLQDIEFQESQRGRQLQSSQDEEYARKLALEEQQTASPSSNRRTSDSGKYGTMTIQPGEKTSVRLFHPHSRSSIGEALYLHYIDRTMMLFELTSAPKRYLRVRPDGIADFAEVPPSDNSAMFVFEALSGGKLYLKSMSPHRGFGRYLALTNGALRGDGDTSFSSEWMLIAANALPGPQSSPSASSRPGLLRRSSSALRDSAVLPAGYASASKEENFEAMNPLFNDPTSLTPPSARGRTLQSRGSIRFPRDDGFSPTASNLFYLSQVFAPVTDSMTQPSPETSTPEQMYSWLTTTPEGREYLNKPELDAAKRLLNKGSLINILHRADWVNLASKYRDFQKEVIPYDINIAKRGLPDSKLRRFFEQGYVTLDKIVGSEDLLHLLKYANHYVFSKPNSLAKTTTYGEMNLTGVIESDFDVLRLFYASPLIDIAQRLLGAKEIQNPKLGKISLHPPSINESYDRISQQGLSWRVEGFTSSGGQTPHSLVIGIALTDFLSDNEGNFCVHPKSHAILHEQLKGEIKMKRAKFADPRPSNEKPNLGSPKQLHLSAGDIVLCTSKLATQIAPNLSSEVKFMVFFHIAHVDHASLKDPSMDGVAGVWVEYKGVDILDTEAGDDDYLSDELRDPALADDAAQYPTIDNSD